MKLNKLCVLFFIGLYFIGICHASDHIDGPVTSKHAVADLTDLFAFPSPKNPEHLVLILDVYPLIAISGHFSDKVKYKFTLSETTLAHSKFQLGQQATITCSFITPHDHGSHTITCVSDSGLSSSVNTELVQLNTQNDFFLFAGQRSDPFFFNSDWALAASNDGIINQPEDKNIMDQLNCLSIVIELNPKILFKNSLPTLISITAQSVTQDENSSFTEKKLDRVGRPEITNVSMVSRNKKDLRDRYNQENPFQISTQNLEEYTKRLFNKIGMYDKMDGTIHWSDKEKQDWVTLLVEDFLVIDMSKPSQAGSFLEIEKSLLSGKPHQTFGGRRLEDDIMDDLFTLYINAGKGEKIKDGVNKPYKNPLSNFPYLGTPDHSISARLKAWVARKFFL